MAASLCHSERLDFIVFFLLNLLLREICDYIFFFSAQVLECIAQTQTYPTS